VTDPTIAIGLLPRSRRRPRFQGWSDRGRVRER